MRYLTDIGIDTDSNFRASKEVSESYLHLRHALELNDVFIAALRLKHTNPRYYMFRRIGERGFRHEPLMVKHDGMIARLIPDGFLDIRERSTDRSLTLLLEHDRGSEQQEAFKRKIRLYQSLLSDQAYKTRLQTNAVTVAFTTFISAKRVAQMREWTRQEVQDAPQLAALFIFAELPKPLEPKHLLFERRWYTLLSDQPIALLEG